MSRGQILCISSQRQGGKHLVSDTLYLLLLALKHMTVLCSIGHIPSTSFHYLCLTQLASGRQNARSPETELEASSSQIPGTHAISLKQWLTQNRYLTRRRICLGRGSVVLQSKRLQREVSYSESCLFFFYQKKIETTMPSSKVSWPCQQRTKRSS